ncbi:hypothetical protein HF526_21580 [Pseudonocardia sp. K10HN5]|uniref:Uncharacterized protein n=1 Tax=Pseudonocardia acidicola TaxID=2724939 RepID=A0ABX1SHD8_9PSEU|nr:hypothetical protein [Pseudonocardia acidicola]
MSRRPSTPNRRTADDIGLAGIAPPSVIRRCDASSDDAILRARGSADRRRADAYGGHRRLGDVDQLRGQPADGGGRGGAVWISMMLIAIGVVVHAGIWLRGRRMTTELAGGR